VWIEKLHMTPSQVAELPFTDIVMVESYYAREAELAPR
jgi:hypothetical protein